MPKQYNVIARQAKAAGMSKRDFLADLNSRHTKITSMAAELGLHMPLSPAQWPPLVLSISTPGILSIAGLSIVLPTMHGAMVSSRGAFSGSGINTASA